jgi:hypothetical protein
LNPFVVIPDAAQRRSGIGFHNLVAAQTAIPGSVALRANGPGMMGQI